MRKNKQHGAPVLKALGEAIRNRRISKQWTQEELASASFMHRTYVTDIENGLRNPSFLTLMKLVIALQCPLSLIIIELENENGNRLS